MSEGVLGIKTLGACQVEWEGEPVKFKTKKSLALIIYLITEHYLDPGARHPRTKLAELLWPGTPIRSALENLRQALYQAKQVWPVAKAGTFPVLSDRQHIWIAGSPQTWEFDVEKLLAELLHQSGPSHKTSRKNDAGDFLAYFYLPQNGAFEDWVTQKRMQIQSVAAEAFNQTANLGVARVEPDAGPAASRGKKNDKTSLVFVLVVLIGLSAFMLASDPMIKGMEEEESKAIAVLPFAALHPDVANAEFLSLGMTDDLITSLAKYRQWTVRPRTSIMKFQHTAQPTRQIAKELRVQYLVEGRVKVHEDQLLLDVKLIDVRANPKVVWTSSFEDKITNVLNLQADVTDKIARSIATVEPDGKSIVHKAVHPQAYAEYLQGRTSYFKATPDDLERALRHFRTAIEIDPDYEEAHLHCANTLTTICSWWGAGRRHIEEELEDIERHLSLAARRPDLMEEVHKVYGWANLWRGKPDMAVEHLEKAVSINPTVEFGLAGLALGYIYQGRFEKALATSRRAQELNPYFGHHYMVEAEALTLLGRYDEAHRSLETALQYWPEYRVALIRDAWAYMLENKPGRACAILRPLYERFEQPPYYLQGYLAVALILDNRQEDALPLLEQMQDAAARGANGLGYYLTLAYTVLDDEDQALDWLEKTLESLEPDCNWLRVDPLFDRLRTNGQFRALMAKHFPE